MERSPWLSNKIESVQKKPAENEAQKAEKKEAARLLRLEVLLANAECASSATELLNDDPEVSAEELIQYLQTSKNVVHPDVAQHFVRHLINTRDLVASTKITAKKSARDDHVGAGKELFKWASKRQPADWRPRGKVRADFSYPLAAVLYVADNEDFERIDLRKNVGGFYEENFYVDTEPSVGPFPLIAIKSRSLANANIESHEKKHAENWEFRKALIAAKRKTVWASFCHYTWSFELTNSWKNDEEKTKDSKIYQATIQRALGNAKDEIIAESRSIEGLEWHLKNLKDKEGLYDYFKRFKDNPSLHEALWSDYVKILDEAVGAVKKIFEAYQDTFLFFSRGHQLPWVLAQIPLDQWSKQLDQVPFLEEAQAAKRASNNLDEVEKICKSLSFEKSEFGANLSSRYYRMSRQEPSTEPQLSQLKKFNEDAETWLARHNNN